MSRKTLREYGNTQSRSHRSCQSGQIICLQPKSPRTPDPFEPRLLWSVALRLIGPEEAPGRRAMFGKIPLRTKKRVVDRRELTRNNRVFVGTVKPQGDVGFVSSKIGFTRFTDQTYGKLRATLLQFQQSGGDEISGQHRRTADAYAAAGGTRKRTRKQLHVIDGGFDLSCSIRDRSPRNREAIGVPPPIDQRQIELLLKDPDVASNGGMVDAKRLRGSEETAFTGEREKVRQTVPIHRDCPFPQRPFADSIIRSPAGEA